MNEKFARWNILLLQYLKRDWKKIIMWVVGLGLFGGGFVPAFEELAKGQGLLGMFETMKNPAMISMVGPTPINSPADYTLGAMYAHEMLLFCGLFSMILSALHVISHTRKEEELGLTELVRSFQVGRQANSLAVMVETALINGLLTIFIGGLLSSFKAETIVNNGTFLFGASVGAAGMIGAAIGLVMAQIMPISTSATSSSLGIVGLFYMIRGVTDVSNLNLSMLNPMGWTYLTFPFTKNNGIPLIYTAVFCVLLFFIAFLLENGRDVGAGYLPEKAGRGAAKKSLLSVTGLFIRINKGVIISWLIAYVVLGAAYGSIYGDMQSFLNSNDLMRQMFTLAGVSLEESFTSTIIMIMIGLVVILPIAIVNKLFWEESRLHLSQIYSTKVTRAKLYWVTIGLAVVSGVIGTFLASIGLGSTAIFTMGTDRSMNIGEFLGAGYNFLPSILFFIGISGLVLGWIPRLGKVVYIYLCYSLILKYFGGLLDIPEWIMKTAIQSWIPKMPVEEFNVLTFLLISAIGVGLMILGYAGYRKRDMLEGA